MAKRSPSRKRRRKPARPRRPVRRFIKRLLGLAVILGLVAGVVGVLILDTFVRSKFEGAKWSLPAHVFSRALEIYEGVPLREDRLC